jgi:hypothetical protein
MIDHPQTGSAGAVEQDEERRAGAGARGDVGDRVVGEREGARLVDEVRGLRG